jgi:hypothetical protein
MEARAQQNAKRVAFAPGAGASQYPTDDNIVGPLDRDLLPGEPVLPEGPSDIPLIIPRGRGSGTAAALPSPYLSASDPLGHSDPYGFASSPRVSYQPSMLSDSGHPPPVSSHTDSSSHSLFFPYPVAPTSGIDHHSSTASSTPSAMWMIKNEPSQGHLANGVQPTGSSSPYRHSSFDLYAEPPFGSISHLLSSLSHGVSSMSNSSQTPLQSSSSAASITAAEPPSHDAQQPSY